MQSTQRGKTEYNKLHYGKIKNGTIKRNAECKIKSARRQEIRNQKITSIICTIVQNISPEEVRQNRLNITLQGGTEKKWNIYSLYKYLLYRGFIRVNTQRNVYRRQRIFFAILHFRKY